jgi:exopolysaccharide biosynthesis polyprenyl glycosylphosphotransferase
MDAETKHNRVPPVLDNRFCNVLVPSEKRITHRFLLLFDLGFIWAGAAFAHGLFVRRLWASHFGMLDDLSQLKKAGILLLFSLCMVSCMQLQRDYASLWKKSIRQESEFLAKAIVASAFITCIFVYLFDMAGISKMAAALTIVLSWTLLEGWRKFLRSQSIAGLTETRNILIVGCGPTGTLLRKQVEDNPHLGYVFKGYVDRRLTGRPPNPTRNEEEQFILGPADELASIARTHFVDEIFISVPSDRHLVKFVAKNARKAGVPVRVIPDLYDGLIAGQSIEYIGRFPTLTIHHRTIPIFQLVMKRLVDIIASALAILLLMPFLLLIAAFVKLASKGPALYQSLRVGRKGNTFRCLKFRTMVHNADALKQSLSHLNERDGILFKIAADPRVTRVGRMLRKSSIDELPQLWNVLKGDMSLVGPRPPLPSEYDKYAVEHMCRLDVTPGVTGLWQIKGRQDPSFASYIQLDTEYVNNWSFWLDCQILWKTIGVVLAGTGQ